MDSTILVTARSHLIAGAQKEQIDSLPPERILAHETVSGIPTTYPRLHSKSLGLVRENMGFCKFVRTFALWLEGRGWSQVELS